MENTNHYHGSPDPSLISYEMILQGKVLPMCSLYPLSLRSRAILVAQLVTKEEASSLPLRCLSPECQGTLKGSCGPNLPCPPTVRQAMTFASESC